MSLLPKILTRIPYLRRLHQVERLRAKYNAARTSMGEFPAGHYYSPIPSDEDVRAHLAQRAQQDDDLGVNLSLRTEAQFALLQEYAQYYADVPWTEHRQESLRYYYDQRSFRHGAAIFLYSLLRHTPPRRIIEVGSGYSSAVMLDTVERFLSDKPAITLIDPNPERLYSVLRPGDQDEITIIADKVQTVPLSVFASLQAGDLLFIDSSHVMKAGSDLYFLMFTVLPHLPPGVIVHFHDIYASFDYPDRWLQWGWYWNEAYFLRGFLAYNPAWQIRFFASYVGRTFEEYLAQHMPLCLKGTGGSSLYIERTNWTAPES